jgi:hypothetical protein
VMSFACFLFLYFSQKKSCEWEAQSPHFYSECILNLWYRFSYSSQPYRCLFFGRGLIKLLSQVQAIKVEQNMNEAHYISRDGGKGSTWYVGYCLSCCASAEWGMMSVEQSVNWEFTGETYVLAENLAQYYFAYQKCAMTWPGIEHRPLQWDWICKL